MKSICTLLLSALTLTACTHVKPTRLFDGESLSGWECAAPVFRVENGIIIGGSREHPLKKGQYLCTKSRYGDFELSLKAKFNGPLAHQNAGVSFRAERVPDSHHVGGYQADMGYVPPRVIARFSAFTPEEEKGLYPLWGILVDEFRPNTSRYSQAAGAPVVMLQIPERALIQQTVNDDGWNELRVRAEGPEITIILNDEIVVHYVEEEDWVPRQGIIGLQVHAGPPCEVMYKDIYIREL